MDEEGLRYIEEDSRFPSGVWKGFYLQYWMPGRHATDMDLTFEDGRLTGSGSDRVGQFTIDGTYDLATGQCRWVKQYVGRHSIEYSGLNEGRGIWGVWELPQLGGLLKDRGGFHIWPEGSDVAEESDEAEAALKVMMRQHGGNRMLGVITVLIVVVALVLVGVVAWLWKMK
jgi:hypothetical protein